MIHHSKYKKNKKLYLIFFTTTNFKLNLIYRYRNDIIDISIYQKHNIINNLIDRSSYIFYTTSRIIKARK